MTITGTAICNIIQSFPVLLILVQNTKKCLQTPLIYKPPSPTHAPEYYEAYDTLINTLLHDNTCHEYQYGVPHIYNKKYSVERKLCYNFYPNPTYGHGYDQNHYIYGYPSYESPHHTYISPNFYGSNHNGYNTTFAYKTNYAPNVTNVKRKYKVVVKRGKKKSQKLIDETCTTMEGQVGSCLNISSCPLYVEILQQAKTNPEAVQILRKAHCGFEGKSPKVCCPRPTIPDASSPTSATSTTSSFAPYEPEPTVSAKSLLSLDYLDRFPVPLECGVSKATFSHVVAGVAELGDFPWMALLGYRTRLGTKWLCGGSLISTHHVLTAAHCIEMHEDSLYVVRLGELDLAREDDGAGAPTDVLIKYKIKHELYNNISYENDIGILVLEQRVQFTDFISPICIPDTVQLKGISFKNYNPLVAGWGAVDSRGPSASHLQVVQLPVVSNENCKKASTYKTQVFDDRVLCVGFVNGGNDTCKGDRGGPLMQPVHYQENITIYTYQTGILSYGRQCTEAGIPGVYTRVTEFVPWLAKYVLGIEKE